MWTQAEFVTLMIQPTALILNWFKQSKKNSLAVVPQAWALKPLDALQLEHGVIFNPTYLAEVIAEFLKEHRLKDAYVSIGLADSMIQERCCWVMQEQPTSDCFASQGQSLVWNYAPIGCHELSQAKLFYIFGITREVLFQYQLLALNVPFNCCTITSKMRALLYALSSLNKASSFSGTLSTDIESLMGHCISSLETQGYEKLFDAPAHFYDFFQEEKTALMASLGLFLLGKSYELQ